MNNCTFSVRCSYNQAAQMDDLAEEIGVSLPTIARVAIKYGLKYHADEIYKELTEEN
nr:hypothetical protein DNLHUEGD_DNLHUEGD_CDS_0009 [Microvirus sp.]